MECGKLFLVLMFLKVVNLSPLKRDATCPYGCKIEQLSTNFTKINVHFIPHSHDDVGWLQTYDGYYYGSGLGTSYTNAGVQYILNSTIPALKANSDRTYVQVETAYFWKWWAHQSDDTRKDVVDLINSGQLEMINGAWSMNDEAAAHYHSIIDQFTWGFRILDETVGECGKPKIGWQIDPFGHSREHASLVKQMGFQGLVLGRIDYRDKKQRIKDKNLDFIWRTSDNLDNSEILTTMFPNFYVYETGFCYDVTCHDTVTESTLATKVEDFTKILDKYADYYQTPNILIPMGQDFSYQAAEQTFKYTDLLINGFIGHDKYNVFYSTPSCYFQAVQDYVSENKIELKIKTDDFFPYASDLHAYWTGYFSSRPASKRFERLGNNILQSVKQLTTFSRAQGTEYDSKINALRTAMGVVQHHDAITGTEKQFVADDYARMLNAAIEKAQEPVSAIIGNLLKKDNTATVDLNLSACLLTNVSVCETTQKDKFLVAVYNPLSWTVTHYVRLPVEGTNYKVIGPKGVEEKFDILDSISSFDYLKQAFNTLSKDLLFAATDLPPLGGRLYYVEKVEDKGNGYVPFEDVTKTDDGVFGTESNGFTIDIKTGQLTSITINKVNQKVTQQFFYYNGSIGINSADHRVSGAYAFEPIDQEALPITETSYVSFKKAKGVLVDEVIQNINSEVTQIIRVYKGTDDSYVEFDWLIGDLKYVGSYGKEVITRFTFTDLNNDGVFYTDSNGRQQIKRELNKRADYEYNATVEPVTSNYYPVTSKIVLKDETKKIEVAVLTDRSQGGTSLNSGEIELMVHRRLHGDDGFGVGETLNEEQYGKGLYIRGQHLLTFKDTESAAAVEREIAHRRLLAPLIFLSDATVDSLDTLKKVQDLVSFEFAGLSKPLNKNVQILTLEPWKESYLLRLEHILEKDEDATLSQSETINLENLFTLFKITTITETTLGANVNLESSKIDLTKITLSPMQIRTFIIKTDLNNNGGKDLEDGTELSGDLGNNGGDDGDDGDKGNGTEALVMAPILIILSVLNILSCQFLV